MKKVVCLLAILNGFLFFTSSCKKDDDDNPSNMTNGKTLAVFNTKLTYGTMTDQDGNTYKTIKIGTQIWMAENLRTTKYNDGTAITLVTNNTLWGKLNTEAYCNYNNTTNTDTIATYGRLYNWYAVNTGKIAPKGWHVPTDSEWTNLTTFLGSDSLVGVKLKETGIKHWRTPNNTCADNSSGFTAIPGGFHHNYGAFINIGYYGNWWSTTEVDTGYAWIRVMGFSSSSVFRDGGSKHTGFSLRCLRD